MPRNIRNRSLEGDSIEDEGILFLFSTFFFPLPPPIIVLLVRLVLVVLVVRYIWKKKSIRTLIHLFRMVIILFIYVIYVC